MNNSELMLHPDGRIYHLDLKPGELAENIILVGDPKRADMVAQFFDTITTVRENREFVTRTGTYNDIPVSVLSTGIGTDNIDIALNEIDALFNIDFESKKVKDELTSVNLIRIGTSGSIQEDIEVDSFLISEFGLGLDGLLNFYDLKPNEIESTLQHEVAQLPIFPIINITPYVVQCSKRLYHQVYDDMMYSGITATCNGFYGPQGRELRLKPKIDNIIDYLTSSDFVQQKVTNFEMETAAIYGLAKLLGHEALAVNLIVANRIEGTKTSNYRERMEDLIKYVLSKL